MSIAEPMPHYRITVRYGGARPAYDVLDIEADDVRAALRRAAAELSDEVAETAELVEVRVQTGPEEREYVEGSSGSPESGGRR